MRHDSQPLSMYTTMHSSRLLEPMLDDELRRIGHVDLVRHIVGPRNQSSVSHAICRIYLLVVAIVAYKSVTGASSPFETNDNALPSKCPLRLADLP